MGFRADDQLHHSKVSALTLPSTSADLTIPYLLRPRQEVLDGAIDRWAKICGADVSSDLSAVGNGKNVVNLRIGSDEGEIRFRALIILCRAPAHTQTSPLSLMASPRPTFSS